MRLLETVLSLYFDDFVQFSFIFLVVELVQKTNHCTRFTQATLFPDLFF